MTTATAEPKVEKATNPYKVGDPPPSPPSEVEIALADDPELAKRRLHRDYQRQLAMWKDVQPWMTFRLKQGAGHHLNLDPDGVERFYRAVEGKSILSKLNLADQWPEKFERIDGYAASQNPYVEVPAPGELPEEFQRRMARLKAQGKMIAASAEATLAGVPANPTLIQPESTAPVHNQQASPPPSRQQADFDKMTVPQLKKYAEDNEITLSPGIQDKAKIIVEIRRGFDVK